MRILVVEDEEKIANAVKRGLEQEAFVVDAVYTGSEGYDLAESEDYDAIILDVMLPDMDGMEIVEKIRKKGINTPVIMLTAKSEIIDKVAGLRIGADDYLTKPFSFDELLARVRALVRRPKAIERNILEIGDLTMDTNNLEVTRFGKIIRLSTKEYTLLQYLIKNQNQVLPKEKIIAHVWNYDDNVLPNTLEVYIGYLRNKIDKPFPNSKPLIHTVRGFGYKIGGEE